MSTRNRQTQRARRREDARRTVRAPHAQVGGVKTDEFAWYHIADAERAKNWKKVLAEDPDEALKELAEVITVPSWDSATNKLELYIKLVERQDKMFRMALNIIYAKLGIDPQSADLTKAVIDRTRSGISPEQEKSLKAYLTDVFQLISGVSSQTALQKVLTLSGSIKNEKLARLMTDDPLSQILMWPERVSNVLIEYIARSLIELKKNPAELVAIVNETNPAAKAALIQTFATSQNAYTLTNTMLLTAMGMRDGFYLWEEVNKDMALIPYDTCPFGIPTRCGQTGMPDTSFWYQFATHANISSADHESYMKASSNIMTLNFARLAAYVYSLYKENQDVRSKILTHTSFSGSGATTKGSPYRPKDALSSDNTAKALRVLDPAQYTFLLHLVYTMSELEGEKQSPPAPPGGGGGGSGNGDEDEEEEEEDNIGPAAEEEEAAAAIINTRTPAQKVANAARARQAAAASGIDKTLLSTIGLNPDGSVPNPGSGIRGYTPPALTKKEQAALTALTAAAAAPSGSGAAATPMAAAAAQQAAPIVAAAQQAAPIVAAAPGRTGVAAPRQAAPGRTGGGAASGTGGSSRVAIAAPQEAPREPMAAAQSSTTSKISFRGVPGLGPGKKPGRDHESGGR